MPSYMYRWPKCIQEQQGEIFLTRMRNVQVFHIGWLLAHRRLLVDRYSDLCMT